MHENITKSCNFVVTISNYKIKIFLMKKKQIIRSIFYKKTKFATGPEIVTSSRGRHVFKEQFFGDNMLK